LNTSTKTRKLLLEPDNNQKLAELCGQFNEHLKLLESNFAIAIYSRGNNFQLEGSESDINSVEYILKRMYHQCFSVDHEKLSPEKIHLLIQEQKNVQENDISMSNIETDAENQSNAKANTTTQESIIIETSRKTIESRGANQADYLKKIEKNDINFGIGPAGTGKTYLAVACAVAALKQEQVNRIVLVRPAVEAGEKLGFLPGDLNEKVNPYLRPLYDALYEMLGFETVDKMLEKQIIEIAPLAYMRGRTLNNAFIILDESQNTTREQMKMFLTRIGFGAKAVITGDVTQIDLPKESQSGLIHAAKVLTDIKDIGFTHFSSKDVVRHRLVQKIIEAYSEHEKGNTIEAISKRSEKS
jgi:phosphate starvation-inducible PhoH-like protein